MSKRKPQFSKSMIALAVITLVLSSYGLYRLAHDFGDMPAFLSLLAVAGFDLTAIAAGNHALTVADDGDSSGAWNLLVIAAALTSAVLQFVHTQLAGQPWAIGVLMAAFPVATVILFEGTVRRVHRLNGRRTGRVAKPRATFEILQWIVYPRATWWAFRRSIADRSLGGTAAFMLGVQATTAEEDDAEETPDVRRTFEWDYTGPDSGRIRELSGSGPDRGPDSSGSAEESAGSGPDTRPLTVLVKESMQVRGADLEAVTADVLAVRPKANPDTIRRTFGKVAGPKAANG